MTIIPWQVPLLAFANRARGGLIKLTSGELGRLTCWGIPFALCLALQAWPHTDWKEQAFYVAALIAAAYGGSKLPAWGANVHLITSKDWWMMTFWGIVMIAPPAAIVAIWGFYYLAAAMVAGSLTISIAYWIGKKIPSTIPQFETGVPLGELFFGLFMGIAVYLATFF